MPRLGDVNLKITADDSDFAKKSRNAKKTISGLGKASAVATKSILAVGAAGITASGGLAIFAKSQADANRELQALVRLSGTSESRFRSIAFASRQFGVEQDKLADILKDTQDKVGDFLATGGGPMKDFFDNIAPKVGITADEFARLSGPDALQAYIDSLEKANLTQSETTFYMEAIANDSTRLLPLFKNQGAELKRLESRYEEVNRQLELTSGQSEGLKVLSEDFDNFSTASSGSASILAATLAPAFSDFFNGITKHIPKATQAIVDFFNTFIDGSNLATVKATDERIASLTKTIQGLQEIIDSGGLLNGDEVAIFNEELAQANQELEETVKRREELLDVQKKLNDAQTFGGGGSFGGTLGTGSLDGGTPPETGKATAKNLSGDEFGFGAWEDPLAATSEQEAILERQREHNEKLLEIERSLWTNKGQITEHGLTAITSMVENNQGKQAGVFANSFASILSSTATYSKKAFEMNKKLALSEAAVKGYQSATSAWAAGMSTGGPWAPFVAAAYLTASLAKTGAQIKAIKSQSYGGGGSSSAGGGTGGASGALPGAQVPQQSNVQPAATIVNMSIQGNSVSTERLGSITERLNEEFEAGYTLRLNS